ncbi:MAG: SAM-dependent chlorinase/fluorinase, partial [Planctomycetes bacterium]|nr:SAM-dependent chlorinase/fluorinase [Planctomycetota bacterium]
MVYARPAGVVTLLTDFGLRDPYVGVMKGAVLRSNPKAVLVDLGHELPPQDVASGAFALAAAVGRFPSGTVHVAVVDPGVGTARRLLAVAAHEAFWLAPDNGLLSDVLAADPGAEARAVDCERLGLVAESRTFHGRDLFAPIAGWLA